MVELLFESKPTVSGAGRKGAFAAPCPSTPFLRLPKWVPARAIMKGAPVLSTDSRDHDWSTHEALTDYASEVCGDFFNTEVQVYSNGEGNWAYVDPHHSGVTMFAIGPRVELLDKYFKAGPYLLSLIARCPFWVMTPAEVMDWANGHVYGWENEAGDGYDTGERHSLPIPHWCTISTEYLVAHTERPDSLPPMLTEIVDAIERNQIERVYHQDWPDEFESFPIGMACWHDVRPYQDKRTKRVRSFGMPEEAGSSPAWMAMDHIGQHAMETGMPSSCHPPLHNIGELEQGFVALALYIRLFKYLSYEQETTGFHLQF